MPAEGLCYDTAHDFFDDWPPGCEHVTHMVRFKGSAFQSPDIIIDRLSHQYWAINSKKSTHPIKDKKTFLKIHIQGSNLDDDFEYVIFFH